jgi:hypothetical protein
LPGRPQTANFIAISSAGKRKEQGLAYRRVLGESNIKKRFNYHLMLSLGEVAVVRFGTNLKTVLSDL